MANRSSHSGPLQQGTWGQPGNLELVLPRAAGSIAHLYQTTVTPQADWQVSVPMLRVYQGGSGQARNVSLWEASPKHLQRRLYALVRGAALGGDGRVDEQAVIVSRAGPPDNTWYVKRPLVVSNDATGRNSAALEVGSGRSKTHVLLVTPHGAGGVATTLYRYQLPDELVPTQAPHGLIHVENQGSIDPRILGDRQIQSCALLQRSGTPFFELIACDNSDLFLYVRGRMIEGENIEWDSPFELPRVSDDIRGVRSQNTFAFTYTFNNTIDSDHELWLVTPTTPGSPLLPTAHLAGITASFNKDGYPEWSAWRWFPGPTRDSLWAYYRTRPPGEVSLVLLDQPPEAPQSRHLLMLHYDNSYLPNGQTVFEKVLIFSERFFGLNVPNPGRPQLDWMWDVTRSATLL